MRSLLIVCAVLVAGLVWAQQQAKQKYSQEQLGARFYYDLGPAEIDVSSYPTERQAGYLVFKKTCSQCHTLARPINSPIVTSKDWQRYVLRMHVRTQSKPGTVISKEDQKVIVEFLAYDAKRRKIDGKKAFEEQTARLKTLFEDVKAERSKRQVQEQKVQESAPYTGAKP